MSNRIMKFLEAITPWRNKDTAKKREDATYSEVRKSIIRRKKLRELNESYRLADIVWEKRNG